MSNRSPAPSRVFLMILLGLFFASAFSGTAPMAVAKEAASKKKEKELPPPETIDLETKDHVLLKATYFPGDKGKETVPVMILHGYEGSRKDFEPLALALQKQGCAVLVPDLRGHGDSTRIRGVTRTLDMKKMSPRQFAAMVTHDLETCKKFLVAKNDEGELNIDKLCLVGSEMGSVVAMEWAYVDWTWPALATGKQGQDVKAMVLISPRWAFRGLQVTPMLHASKIHRQISIMIIVGREDKNAVKDAKRIHKILERSRPKTDPNKAAERTLYLLNAPTSLQGAKLVNEKTMHAPFYIGKFFKLRAADQKFPWKQRKSTP